MDFPSDRRTRVVRMGADDWRHLRELRLQALADTPHAFLETFVHAVSQTDDDWRARAARAAGPDEAGFAAVVGDRWVGMMRGVDHGGKHVLQSVFVVPGHRGRQHGTADALLDAVEAWAAGRGATALFLDVHAANHRAQRLYRRRGYVFTGVRTPYRLAPAEDELEMRRPLPPAG